MKILVVEENSLVKDTVSMMLTHLACVSVVVNTGDDAVEAYRCAFECGTAYDLVIVDGKETFEKIRSINPEAKAILSVAYPEARLSASDEKAGILGIIVKPYSLTEFERVLRRVLNR